MQMKLPDKDMRWLSKEEIENLDISNFEVNGDYGLVLEVCNSYFFLYQFLIVFVFV